MTADDATTRLVALRRLVMIFVRQGLLGEGYAALVLDELDEIRKIHESEVTIAYENGKREVKGVP